ncbi:hypothetical protein [Cellulomonas sp.]
MAVGWLGDHGVCTGSKPYFIERVPFNAYNYGGYGYWCAANGV